MIKPLVECKACSALKTYDTRISKITAHRQKVIQRFDCILNHLTDSQVDKILKNDGIQTSQLFFILYSHDISKISGIEFAYLWDEHKDKPAFDIAIKHHWKHNAHHPEHYKGGIKEMPEIYLIEMVCDWDARCEEFNKDMNEWLKEANKRWNIPPNIRRKIRRYLSILRKDMI